MPSEVDARFLDTETPARTDSPAIATSWTVEREVVPSLRVQARALCPGLRDRKPKRLHT